MGAHSAPIHSLRCNTAAEAFFSSLFSTKKEGRERGRRKEGGEGSWRKEGADLIFDWTRPVLVKLDLTKKPYAAGL